MALGSGAPAKDAEGKRPSEPGMTEDSSERLREIGQFRLTRRPDPTYMSPNRFSVTTTPFNFLGLATMIMAAESTK